MTKTDPHQIRELSKQFERQFEHKPTVAAHAPGRIEVLGNHTDYNLGYTLSAAIDLGTTFVAAPSKDATCRIFASNMSDTVTFSVDDKARETKQTWANYIKGVLVKLQETAPFTTGFDAAFVGDIPLGAGLSSSAALEMASGLALAKLYGRTIEPLAMAKIGQWSEHNYAGVKCGLLDQISSLYGREGGLTMIDFKSLEVKSLPMGHNVCFLMCNTNVKHALVDTEYNQLRAKCEEAAAYFKGVLKHEVTALRDVSQAEWNDHSSKMDKVAAKRSAHIVGENRRVVEGAECLARGDLKAFGQLMFESHESSRVQFENSCKELDHVVASAKQTPGVLGARLSGGGFGGSAVLLVEPTKVGSIAGNIGDAYRAKFGTGCEIRRVSASAGGRLIPV